MVVVAAAGPTGTSEAGLEGLLIVGISAAAGAKIAVIVPPWLSALHCAGFLVDGASAGRHIGVHRVNVLSDIVQPFLPAGHPLNGHAMIQITGINPVHSEFLPSGVSASMVKSYQSNSRCQSVVTCASSYPADSAMSMTYHFS